MVDVQPVFRSSRRVFSKIIFFGEGFVSRIFGGCGILISAITAIEREKE